jgi:hypothetical protein
VPKARFGLRLFNNQKFEQIMRPKVVILILVAAFGLLGIMVVLKGVMGGHASNAGGQTPATQANVDSQSAATNDQVVQVNPNSSNTAASSEQLRAAVVGKELDAIQALQGEADGANNPTIISALIGKVENPEAEVRTAALAALVQLNDTNAVPGLQQTAELMKDPRAKVAVMDTIDYLMLPSIMPDVPPADLDTNIPDMATIPQNLNMNPLFLHTNRNNVRLMNNRRQAAPPNASAGQPQ